MTWQGRRPPISRGELLVTIAVLVTVAACNGDDGGISTTTGRPPTTTVAAGTTRAPTTTSGTTTTLSDTPSTSAAPTTTRPAGEGWYLAWVPAELPEGFVAGVAGLPRVEVVSAVSAGNGLLITTRAAAGTVVDQAPDGYAFPVEVQVLEDPDAHAEFVPEDAAAVVRSLGEDEVLLSESSARLRRLGVGATLDFEGGVTVTVAGVVPDAFVGAAEVVTTRGDPQVLADVQERYVVLRHPGPKSDLERALAGVTDQPVQVRAWGETDVFRHGDAVRPQVAIKGRFGEFAVRVAGGGFEQDPAWREANIVRVDLPLLGTFACHRDMAAILEQVMGRLVGEGQSDVIDRSAFAGCYNARFIAGRTDLSHHAWGAAADINIYNTSDGPDAAGSPVNAALLEAMYDAGLTSGHAWILADPGHFEWYADGPIPPGTPPRP